MNWENEAQRGTVTQPKLLTTREQGNRARSWGLSLLIQYFLEHIDPPPLLMLLATKKGILFNNRSF
jgi:hypothetical protein